MMFPSRWNENHTEEVLAQNTTYIRERMHNASHHLSTTRVQNSKCSCWWDASTPYHKGIADTGFIHSHGDETWVTTWNKWRQTSKKNESLSLDFRLLLDSTTLQYRSQSTCKLVHLQRSETPFLSLTSGDGVIRLRHQTLITRENSYTYKSKYDVS